jgi:hypothetical protein
MATSDNSLRFIGPAAVIEKKRRGGLASLTSGRLEGMFRNEALRGSERPTERLKEIDCSDCMVCGACVGEPAPGWHAGHRRPVKCRVKPCPGWADKTSEDGYKCVAI